MGLEPVLLDLYPSNRRAILSCFEALHVVQKVSCVPYLVLYFAPCAGFCAVLCIFGELRDARGLEAP